MRSGCIEKGAVTWGEQQLDVWQLSNHERQTRCSGKQCIVRDAALSRPYVVILCSDSRGQGWLRFVLPQILVVQQWRPLPGLLLLDVPLLGKAGHHGHSTVLCRGGRLGALQHTWFQVNSQERNNILRDKGTLQLALLYSISYERQADHIPILSISQTQGETVVSPHTTVSARIGTTTNQSSIAHLGFHFVLEVFEIEINLVAILS